jgi:hypothetical protein
MSQDELVKMLLEAGFLNGWAMCNSDLTLWLHDQDPPAPLTRPEAPDETPSPD